MEKSKKREKGQSGEVNGEEVEEYEEVSLREKRPTIESFFFFLQLLVVNVVFSLPYFYSLVVLLISGLSTWGVSIHLHCVVCRLF